MTGILQAILSFFGVQASSSANYIEDVFSTYLYTGTGSSQTITNNIDTTTYGGLVWIKGRSGATGHRLTDTARGTTKSLASNSTDAEATESTGLTAFGTTGFTIGADADYNTNTATYVSWAFRKQAKFFDVVTYTGNSSGGSSQTIAHNLGSVPGCIIVKATSIAGEYWAVWHRSFTTNQVIYLNLTNAVATTSAGNSFPTLPTATNFTVGFNGSQNGNGTQYVAYLFAHDAGGFGAAGTDNVISCGTFTASATETATVTLGYEPQWLLFKPTSTTGDWQIVDTMRPWPVAADAFSLKPNTSAAEANVGAIKPSATGFYATSNLIANATYIYIAIRRGPMRTPTSGTSVFSPVVYTGTNVDNRLVDMSLLTDMVFVRQRNDTVLGGMVVGDRLRGNPYLLTGTTAAEVSDANSFMTPTAGYGNSWSAMNGFGVGNDATSKLNASTTSNNQIAEGFRRAPGFFDVVCYTGTGANATQTHNLGVVPELIIVKRRGATGAWPVYSSALSNTEYLVLNTTAAKATGTTYWNSTTPTSTVFSLGTAADVNASTAGNTYVAYLFATVTGVSKVGTYVGNATVNGQSQNIDCGFTAGARFVMIKCTSTTGDWYVFDSARGIVAGNDPFLFLNSTAAETTSLDCVDSYSQGFTVVQQSGGDVNVNNATYIFLAIA